MPHYLVYTGNERAQFSVNSRAQPGFKYIVKADLPFKIMDDDIWMASLRGMEVLSTVNFVPIVKRNMMGDPTYCSPWEGAFLEGLAANCPDPARIVEIGTGKGTSLARILYGLSLHEDVRVWSIDLEEQEETRSCLENAQIPNWRYEMLIGDSAEIGKGGWEKLDLVYIDGSHSDPGVRADVEAWDPHLKPEGVLAFHDYGDPLHNVTDAIDEMMAEGWVQVGLVGTIAAYVRQP